MFTSINANLEIVYKGFAEGHHWIVLDNGFLPQPSVCAEYSVDMIDRWRVKI